MIFDRLFGFRMHVNMIDAVAETMAEVSCDPIVYHKWLLLDLEKILIPQIKEDLQHLNFLGVLGVAKHWKSS